MTGGPAARLHAPQRAMDGLDGLNPEQRAAVEQSEGPVLILAGAGSGKTRVIAYRIARLIGSGLAYEREVLAVTFTNKAAEEMRQRVANLLGNDVKGLWISTFHALCAKLLRREGPAIGLTRDFVIYDSSDQQSAIKQALKDVHADEKLIPPRLALSRISQAKNQMKGPESLDVRVLELPRSAAGQGLRALQRAAEGERRRRLRRPAPEDGGAVREVGVAFGRATRRSSATS